MTKAFVLYNNTAHSKAYLEDLKSSLASLSDKTNIEIIPVEGYYTDDARRLYRKLGYRIIPYYTQLLESDKVSEEFKKELNGALCNSLGHALIWNLIKDEAEPCIVLEHDAIFKHSDIDLSELEDFMIFWLGPRIQKNADYIYPKHFPRSLKEIRHFEGTHAYAITPKTANFLSRSWNYYGFVDSTDGALAMRNWYKLINVVMDPPPVVAVVNRSGDLSTTIGSKAATWNSCNTDGFLAGLSSSEPPLRTIELENKSFIENFPTIVLKNAKILAFCEDDGSSISVLSNALLDHYSSTDMLHYVCPSDKVQVIKYKSYFSHYYYKLHNICNLQDFSAAHLVTKELAKNTKYNLVFLDGSSMTSIDLLFNVVHILESVNRCLVMFDPNSKSFVESVKHWGYDIMWFGPVMYIQKSFT